MLYFTMKRLMNYQIIYMNPFLIKFNLFFITDYIHIKISLYIKEINNKDFRLLYYFKKKNHISISRFYLKSPFKFNF